jgi:hypothetical protein
MKTVFQHIENAKTKPYHIRKQIAFAAATFTSAFIALVWFVGSFSSGTFAIKGSTFAESTQQPTVIVTGKVTGSVAGAAAALQDATAPAHIEIVDTTAAAPAKNRAEQTTIPF